MKVVKGIAQMGNSNGKGIIRSDRCPFRIFPPQEENPAFLLDLLATGSRLVLGVRHDFGQGRFQRLREGSF